MNLNLVKRLAIGSFIGGIFGYLIIHPIFMLMDDYFVHHNFSALQSILTSFSGMHFATSLILTILGLTTGFLLGLYNYKISSLIEKTHLLSITDELTQINNRRYFINELGKEIERAKRFSRSLSLIILDVDKLKYFNDTFGHILGDKIIKSAAVSISGTIRKTDFAARYGGDEFVIVMPETDKNIAEILGERLQKKFSENFFEYQRLHLKIKISISLGVASFPDDAKNVEELIHAADLALFKNKADKVREAV